METLIEGMDVPGLMCIQLIKKWCEDPLAAAIPGLKKQKLQLCQLCLYLITFIFVFCLFYLCS